MVFGTARQAAGGVGVLQMQRPIKIHQAHASVRHAGMVLPCVLGFLGALLVTSGIGCQQHARNTTGEASAAGAAAMTESVNAEDPFIARPLPDGRGSVRDALGDWDDVHAAMLAAATHCSMTHERVRLIDPHEVGHHADNVGAKAEPADTYGGLLRQPERREYDMLTISGLTGTLVIERLGPDAAIGPGERIRMHATIGPLGKASTEACLLNAIGVRLEQLRGVRAAPIRWSD
jgi:hypothetical protein